MKTKHAVAALVPPELLPEIAAAAAEERRAPSELVGEAVERDLSQRRWIRRDEAHAKIARGLASLRQGKGLDGEAAISDLLAEFDTAAATR